MKLLIAAEGPGTENLPAQFPALTQEIKSFVSHLVKSRTRGPEPKVEVIVAHDDAVLVTTQSLIKLQEKAAALRILVECPDRQIASALTNAKLLLKTNDDE